MVEMRKTSLCQQTGQINTQGTPFLPHPCNRFDNFIFLKHSFDILIPENHVSIIRSKLLNVIVLLLLLLNLN